MLRSSIDLGTNTCLLLIADWDPEKREVSRTISDHSVVVRLGQGVDQSRELAPPAMERTLMCLREYSQRVREAGLDPADTLAVATSQARDARNGQAFFDRVLAETGFRFRTLSGADEARYTFLGGLLPGMDFRACAVIDIGGGSTEFMALKGGQSIDVGCVRYTERFFKGASDAAVTDEQFWSCQDAIDLELHPLLEWRGTLAKKMQLVAVAGTATTLAAWHLGLNRFDASQIDEVVLTRGDVHRQVEELKWRTPAERRQLPGVEEGRADVLLAGALILWRAMEILNFPECRVSSRGLRYGILQA